MAVGCDGELGEWQVAGIALDEDDDFAHVN
jgi:hypothetical protein